MAGIVYDGVGDGGNLFAGLSLHILQRVPARERWKEVVEANGGKITLLEKHADYIIADHVRADAPPGSISWRWIEKSTKNGKLEAVEDYPAGPPALQVRDVGSKLPKRHGRIPFTAEDDRFLMKWAMKAERKGISTKGNEIYKQLEKVNPRHTFQSWRDRWVKYVSRYPQTEPSDGADDGDGQVASPVARSTRQSVPQPPTQMPSSNTVQSPPPRTVHTKKSGDETKNQTANSFTNSERRLLINAYDDIINIDENKVIDAWNKWASTYPSHSAQEWLNYFKKKIIPKVEAKKKEAEQVKTARQKSGPPIPLPQAAPSSTIKSKAISLNQTPQHGPSPKDPLEPPSGILDSQTTENKATDTQTISAGFAAVGDIKGTPLGVILLDETRFREDLTALAEEIGFTVNFHASICGRTVSLFRLWQVVNSQGFGGYDRVTRRGLWSRVAKELNFNEFRHQNAAEDLSLCYNEILTEFEQLRKECPDANQDLTESQEKSLLDAQLLQGSASMSPNFKENSYGHDLDRAAPAPVRESPSPSGKRIFRTNSQEDDTRRNKKKRFDKGKGREPEIPSTPPEVPRRAHSPSAHPPSPSKGSVILETQAEVYGKHDIDKDFVSPAQKSISPRPVSQRRQIQPQPETQDFLSAGLEGYKDKDTRQPTSSPSRPLPHNPGYPDNRSLSGEPPGDSSQTAADWQNVQDFIDRHIALGYKEIIVIDALLATTLETGNAAVVMEELAHGNGIPENMEGVWTAQDDEAVDTDEASEGFQQLLVKHGRERIDPRRRFLQDSKE